MNLCMYAMYSMHVCNVSVTACINKKNLISVYQCFYQSGICVMVCYALATLFNQRSSGVQPAFNKRPFPVQMQKEESCSTSQTVHWFVVKCVCLWVLKPTQDARAIARHGKRTTACMTLKGWTAWKWFYWVKHRTVWNSKICVPSVTRQTRH
jgi:hypothetical protein